MGRIKVCVYSGDESDEYCKNCDGKTITVNGKNVSATQCPGYSTKLEEEEDDLPFTDSSAEVENEVEQEEEVSDTSESNGFASNLDDNVSDDKNIDSDTEAQETSKPAQEKHIDFSSEFSETTELCFSSGASVEVNGIWYKFVCEERRVLKPNADVVEEREKLWATVNNEVDKQLEEVVKFQKSN